MGHDMDFRDKNRMTPNPKSTEPRKEWISLLAAADPAWLKDRLMACKETLDMDLHPHYMVPPETGMIIMQARQDGAGPRFNLGEVTVSRCILKLGEVMGYAMVMGSDLHHAELAAFFDALLQMPEPGRELRKKLVPELRRQREERHDREAADTETSKVEFFTMKRGE